ncbi:MAG TPA: serine hydrolase, partial [Xanthobacteraceae bacterium]|nr:serine hydrolase [Xanthobacteraceae bacterium]
MKHLVLCLLFLSAFFAVSASAEDIQTDAHVAYIVDYQTGAVMLDKNGEERIEPASLTKLMTVYLLFEQLKSGKMKLSDMLTVSETAWRMQGSKMFVELGNQIRLEDLLRGIIVQSGNDACVVVAEAMAGSEQAFAERMN